jgi:NADH:ubiquinone oxidoreductase subunit
MHIGTKLYTIFNGIIVGRDSFGNCYFESKKADKKNNKKRWVVYKGIAEPSKVPPEWHGWLHYTFDAPITIKKQEWQKDFLPNLTGTDLAYMPPGHVKKGSHRDKATGDYEAWRP